MNNFDIGWAIVDKSLALRGSSPCSQARALAILDTACEPWRNETAEFESRNPGKRDEVHPDYDNETDPIAPFGGLLQEAFWPDIPSEVWNSLRVNWGLRDDDLTDAEHRLHYDWYARVEFEFMKRYGLYSCGAVEPMPYGPPIRFGDEMNG